jgi:hypothetical protein
MEFIIDALPIEEVTDPDVQREINRVIDLAGRNRQWFGAHAHKLNLFDLYRGRFIAVSEGEFFVSDTPEEAEKMAQSAHPDDIPFMHYISKEKVDRVQASQQ